MIQESDEQIIIGVMGKDTPLLGDDVSVQQNDGGQF